MTAKSGTRDNTLDVARGLGMLLLIYAHALEIILKGRPDDVFLMSAFVQYKFICAFDVPLFFLISGAANRNIARKTLREVAESSLRLIALAYMVHVAGGILLYFDRTLPWTDFEVVKGTLTPFIKGAGFSTIVLWFLYALGIVQLLFYVMLRSVELKSARLRVALWAVLAVLGAASVVSLFFPATPSFQQVKAWVPGLILFGLGYWLHRRGWMSPPVLLAIPLFAVVALLAPLNNGCLLSPSASCPIPDFHEQFAVYMINGTLGFLPLFLVTAVLGCYAMLALSRLKLLAPIAFLGRYSLELFVINGFSVVFVNFELDKIPFDQLGWGMNGYDVVAIMVVAQIVLFIFLRPLFSWLRTSSQWLAVRAYDIIAYVMGRTWAVFAARAEARRPG